MGFLNHQQYHHKTFFFVVYMLIKKICEKFGMVSSTLLWWIVTITMYSDHLLGILIYLVMNGSRALWRGYHLKAPKIARVKNLGDCQIHWVFPYQDLKIRLCPTGFDLGILKFETCSFFFSRFSTSRTQWFCWTNCHTGWWTFIAACQTGDWCNGKR